MRHNRFKANFLTPFLRIEDYMREENYTKAREDYTKAREDARKMLKPGFVLILVFMIIFWTIIIRFAIQ